MTVNWRNVDTWFGAFSAPCAKKGLCGLVYPFFCVCAKERGLVSSVFAARKESGQDVVLSTTK